MLQVRSSLDVADNTGAKVAWNIGVTGRNQEYAGIGDVIKVHIKEAAPTVPCCGSTGMPASSLTRN
jgi:large subunit ribosomal protein L14